MPRKETKLPLYLTNVRAPLEVSDEPHTVSNLKKAGSTPIGPRKNLWAVVKLYCSQGADK